MTKTTAPGAETENTTLRAVDGDAADGGGCDSDGSSAYEVHDGSLQKALIENRLRSEITEVQSQREALTAICQSLERQLNTAKEQLGNRCVALEVGAAERETELKRQNVRHVVLAAIVAAMLGLPLGFAIGTVTGWIVGTVMSLLLLAPSLVFGIVIGVAVGHSRILNVASNLWLKLYRRAEELFRWVRRLWEHKQRLEQISSYFPGVLGRGSAGDKSVKREGPLDKGGSSRGRPQGRRRQIGEGGVSTGN